MSKWHLPHHIFFCFFFKVSMILYVIHSLRKRLQGQFSKTVPVPISVADVLVAQFLLSGDRGMYW